MSDNLMFENILDECLGMLLKGRRLEECLKAYPEQAEALRPLLETAIAARSALAFVSRPAFKVETRRLLLNSISEMKGKRDTARAPIFSGLKQHWATLGVSIALAILLAGGGLAAASGSAMPGEFLYGVKLAVEQVMLSFSFSDESKAETYARLADRRVAEIIYLAARADVTNIGEATKRLDGYLASITAILSPATAEDGAMAPSSETDPRDGDIFLNGQPDKSAEPASDLGRLLQQYALQQVTDLEQALLTAPEAVKPALYEALAVALAGYQNILNVTD